MTPPWERRRRAARARIVGIGLVAATLMVLGGICAAEARAATPSLVPQASSSGFPAGVSIYDSATISFGNNPTGTLEFRAFPPSDATCSGPPAFTSTKQVSGNGYYSSDYFPTAVAGTYRWVATYSGDAGNTRATTACTDPAQHVTMAKRSPTLNSTASPLSPRGKLTSTGVLDKTAGTNGGSGTITFTLYGADNMVCAGPPVFTSTRPVNGNGTYTSEPFTPTAAGTYRWISRYSGDDNTLSAQTTCADPAQSSAVTRPGAFTTADDYDGDGSSDFSVYRSGNASWYIWPSRSDTWGTEADIPVPADYDGDGKVDLAVYNTATGAWHVRGGATVTWGIVGDIPVPGDYDGDGKADFAVYRPTLGTWHIRGAAPVSWGIFGDIPVPGDYDGNGTSDIAVFRPALGMWYVRGTGNTFWGQLGDIPVPGDYDGNRTSDYAVYRPSSATWYVRGGKSVIWGTAGDIPVPGDYDGDGRVDVATYRPSTGTWYVRDPAPAAAHWGESGDVPLALPGAIRQPS